MPRAFYDSLGTCRSGPDDPVPNTVKFTEDCRLVAQNHIATQVPILLRATHYVNWDGPPSYAGDSSLLGTAVIWFPRTADVWEIPAGSGQFYRVVRTMSITPLRAPLGAYRRAHLLKLP